MQGQVPSRTAAHRWVVWLALLGCAASPAATAQQTVGGIWSLRGPQPTLNGQVEGIPDRPVTGAVEALAPHPTNPDILYAASVNGGIWRTNNARAASPTWVPLTQALPSGSMGAIAFDSADTTHQTLVAGTAKRSAYYRDGGALLGMLRSTDGGANWTILDPGGPLSNQPIAGVVAFGTRLLAATPDGLWLSLNGGSSFVLRSGATGSGLPAGRTTDLAVRPGSPNTYYTVVINVLAAGVYRSSNGGGLWSRVSSPAMDAQLNPGAVQARLAVASDGAVVLGVVRGVGNERLAEVWWSANGTSGWTALGVPSVTEANGRSFGIHPGGQGDIHFSLAIDPTDSSIVYVGGDRQPHANEDTGGQQWPNALGARNFTGRLFRGDADLPAASRWTSITHNNTAGGTAPHADSRDLVFDAGGDLLEADDGGVYRRSQPRSSNGDWSSVNGTLAVTEYHSVAYDLVSRRVVGGSQDNGTSRARSAQTRLFDVVIAGDGGEVAIEDRSSTTTSTRYISAQNLQSFVRQTVDANNNVTSSAVPMRSVPSGTPALTPQFYTPIAANAASATRIIIGGANGIYESFDRGDTLNLVATRVINQNVGGPIIYGLPGNADYLLVGSGTNVLRRTSGGGALTQIANLPDSVADVAVDPGQSSRLFAITDEAVFHSNTSSPSFFDITGNLASFAPGRLRTLAFAPIASRALLLGADGGVFVSYLESGFSTWYRLGTSLPEAPVMELEYEADASGVLLAGTLGAGSWLLGSVPPPPAVSPLIFANGFE